MDKKSFRTLGPGLIFEGKAVWGMGVLSEADNGWQ